MWLIVIWRPSLGLDHMLGIVGGTMAADRVRVAAGAMTSILRQYHLLQLLPQLHRTPMQALLRPCLLLRLMRLRFRVTGAAPYRNRRS
jgi:hypothetical protein